ncbi:hypothetical protein NVIE_0991 [Nitrososphaera viennensis EN76]|uniref:Uncharacterized protein n=1 Tax=Nitrososphaera viennensis EN76 TaxID=926571 RepID=A0A060HEU5_9ARCH|nr:hypothetical protein NVIE_0991 [Nitrososphaera viennensis EN76]
MNFNSWIYIMHTRTHGCMAPEHGGILWGGEFGWKSAEQATLSNATRNVQKPFRAEGRPRMAYSASTLVQE